MKQARYRRVNDRRCAGEPHLADTSDGAMGAGARVPATKLLTRTPVSKTPCTEPTALFSHRMRSYHDLRMSTATMTCLTIGLHACIIEPTPALALAPRHGAPRTDTPSCAHYTQQRAGAFQTPFPLNSDERLRDIITRSEISHICQWF